MCVTWMLLFLQTITHAQTSASRSSNSVIVVKWATHPALDELQDAFVSNLNEYEKTNDPKIHFTLTTFNCDGDKQRAIELAETLFRPNVQLIVTLGTPCSQAICKIGSNTPVLYAAVSDPLGAGLFNYPNITGIANVSSEIISNALGVIATIQPQINKLGTIYNPLEQNSLFVHAMIEKQCSSKGIQLISRRISETDRLSEAAQNLYKVENVDAIYCANDNKVNLGIAGIVAASLDAKKPFIIGEISAIKSGASLAVGVDYTSTGKSLSELAIQILSGQQAKSIPPTRTTTARIILNYNVLKEITLDVPASLSSRAEIYKESK